MAMEWAHALATAEDAETKRRLDQVVLLLLPSINPDGQIMETEWYRKNLGTRYEGGRMPWLYHHYVGHDNNRDWFMLTQKETQAVSRAVYHEWLPQVWLDEHQMGPTGPRIFTPPYAEPVDPDIHPLVWRDVNLIGANMDFRLEQAGKSGVIYGYVFDAYWPGGTKNTAWWKNVSGLLTEVASVRFATPVRIEPNELSGGGKGLVEYGTQTNFPNPWPGGTWRLRDIMDYERIASDAILETCAERRADFLRNALARAKAAIATYGASDAFRIPAGQRDAAGALRLAALLAEHGVEVKSAPGGDVYVPLAQPYGRFVNELLTAQRYPETKLVAGKDIVRPYDVAAWTLPLMMGVTVERATLPAGLTPWAATPSSLPTNGAAFALAPGSPETARLVNAGLRGGALRVARAPLSAGGREWPAGTVFLDGEAARAAVAKAVMGQSWTAIGSVPEAAEPLRAPRVGLYKPWAASMDEGWTRFVLEQYGFEPMTLDNKAVRAGGLSAAFDAIVLPDLTKEVLSTGKPKRDEGAMRYFAELPPEYAGGLEKEGAAALKDFVEKGGTLVALSSSVDYVIDELTLPVRNGLSRASDFAIAGLAPAGRGRLRPPGHLRPAERGRGVPGRGAGLRHRAARPRDGKARARELPGGRCRRAPLGLDPRRGGDRPQGRGRGAHLRQGKGRAPRLPRTAPRADAGHVPVPVQRALLVHGEVAARLPRGLPLPAGGRLGAQVRGGARLRPSSFRLSRSVPWHTRQERAPSSGRSDTRATRWRWPCWGPCPRDAGGICRCSRPTFDEGARSRHFGDVAGRRGPRDTSPPPAAPHVARHRSPAGKHEGRPGAALARPLPAPQPG